MGHCRSDHRAEQNAGSLMNCWDTIGSGKLQQSKLCTASMRNTQLRLPVRNSPPHQPTSGSRIGRRQHRIGSHCHTEDATATFDFRLAARRPWLPPRPLFWFPKLSRPILQTEVRSRSEAGNEHCQPCDVIPHSIAARVCAFVSAAAITSLPRLS